MNERFRKWTWEMQLPQAQTARRFPGKPTGSVLHGGGPGCVWEGTALSHRHRNQGRSLLPEALPGSLGSSSSYITCAWQNCDAINPNMLPLAHPSLILQG